MLWRMRPKPNIRTPSLFALITLTVALWTSARSGAAIGSGSGEDARVLRIDEGYVDAHGVLIYFKAFGQGPPLIIVHGGPGASHDYFLPHLLPLARTSRLVFIDERGGGKSGKLETAADYTVENMVEDTEAVRVALDLGKIDLLGHS